MSDWRKSLSAAEGYFCLGLVAEAALAFEEIPTGDRERPEVLGFQIFLHKKLGRWAEAATASVRMINLQPECVDWWISFAYATRRAESVETAEKILREAATKFPNESTIWFNLACYCSVTGRCAEALSLLRQAISRNPQFKLMALEDEDLSPIWDSIAVLE